MSATSTPEFYIDRATGTLDATLLSSQTSGDFTFTAATLLGTQSWNMPGGHKAILTLEDEQILVNDLSASGATVTATIEERGYNGTTAATHTVPGVVNVDMNVVGGNLDNLQSEIDDIITNQIADEVSITNLQDNADQGLVFLGAPQLTTIIDNHTHQVTGADETGLYVPGRKYVFEVSGTWYKGVVASSTFGGGNTTIKLVGQGLPNSGTVTTGGMEYSPSQYANDAAVLMQEMSSDPVVNPPSGYNWFYVKGDTIFTMNSSGVIQGYNPQQGAPFTSGEAIGSVGMPLYMKTSDQRVYKASSAAENEAEYSYIGVSTTTVAGAGLTVYVALNGMLATIASQGQPTASVSATVDVQYTGTGTNTPLWGTSNKTIEWYFQSGINPANMSKVDIDFGPNTGTPPTTVTLTLYDINGTSLGSATVNTPTPNAVNTFTFGSPIAISPRTMYRLTIGDGSNDVSNHHTIVTSSAAVPVDIVASIMPDNGSTSYWGFTQGVPNFKTYYTSQYNWSSRDYVFLNDTAGTLSMDEGTVCKPVGFIVSPTQMIVTTASSEEYAMATEFTWPTLQIGSSTFAFLKSLAIPLNARKVIFRASSVDGTAGRYWAQMQTLYRNKLSGPYAGIGVATFSISWTTANLLSLSTTVQNAIGTDSFGLFVTYIR